MHDVVGFWNRTRSLNGPMSAIYIHAVHEKKENASIKEFVTRAVPR